jgi:hypothetical protein
VSLGSLGSHSGITDMHFSLRLGEARIEVSSRK